MYDWSGVGLINVVVFGYLMYAWWTVGEHMKGKRKAPSKLAMKAYKHKGIIITGILIIDMVLYAFGVRIGG